MIKLKLALISIFFFLIIPANHVHAGDKPSGHSAVLKSEYTSIDTHKIIKINAIKSVLKKYNSKLEHYSYAFVDASIKYDLDPYLLVSIAGLESYFGRLMIEGTYNGFGWGSGTIYFESWEDSIENISRSLRYN